MERENKSFDENGLQFAWDSSSLKTFETCPRKYFYEIIEGWEPFDKSVHLVFGAHYASALERYYKFRAMGQTMADALDNVLALALLETWNHKTIDGVRQPGGAPWISGHPAKTRENLIRSIVWYVDQFDGEGVEVVTLRDGKPAVEYSFTVELTDDILWCGHIDRLVTYAGEYYIMDQKTTGHTITQRFFDQFNPDTQMTGYTFAGQIIYNLPVKGVIIDGAQIAVGFTRFERGYTFRTQDQLEEWHQDAVHNIARARSMTQENYFPMNTTACGNYGGCPFRDVCSRPKAVRENFLKQKFVKSRNWDPLERR